MTRSLSPFGSRSGSHPARGQAMVIFTLALTGILGIAGLLLEVGSVWVTDRQAQNAADMAGLAAGKAIDDGNYTVGNCGSANRNAAIAAATTAAQSIASLNGFTSVTVNFPPTVTPTSTFRNCNYVEVVVSRTVNPSFAKLLGQTAWRVSGAAVVQLPQNYDLPASACVICALAPSGDSSLEITHDARLQVAGGIYVNSDRSSTTWDTHQVYGNAIKIVGGPAYGDTTRLSATTIRVRGGWKRNDDRALISASRLAGASDTPASTCATTPNDHLELKNYSLVSSVPANVCRNAPLLADPLGALPAPVLADHPVRFGTAASPNTRTIDGTTTTLSPGIYYGGIEIKGGSTVTMNPGVYIMAGSGNFTISATSALNAQGVMIYAHGNKTGKRIWLNSPNGSIVWTAPTSGTYAGILGFVDRSSLGSRITILLDDNAQCVTTNGCVGGLSGTLYAANNDNVIEFDAGGTASMRMVAGNVSIRSRTATTIREPGTGATAETPIRLVE